MKYFISKQKNLFKDDYYSEISFEEAKERISKLNTIQFDTETMGLDVYTKPLLCYQLGNKENQYVFDHSSYPITLFKDIFESDRLFIGHNIKFDLKYLYYYNIWPKFVYDTMLAEQLIWLGYSYRAVDPSDYVSEGYKFPYLVKENKQTHQTYYEFSCSLQAVGKNRLNIDLDKTVRGKIRTVGLVPEVIKYAATDVEYLEDIKDSQLKDIEREDLATAVKFENEFVKCLAYIEFCGVKLDVNKWKAKMKKDQEKLDKAVNTLNGIVLKYFNDHQGNISRRTIKAESIIDTQWIHSSEELKKYGLTLGINHQNSGRYYTRPSGIEEVGTLYCQEIYIPYPWVEQNLQGDLFTGFNPEPYCTINWSSSQQLIPFFELLGFNVEIFDKKEKRKKKSVAAEVIKSQRDVFPELSDAYVEFKKAEKICDSFGEKWLKAINPVTGRIHPDFHQIGTNTSRLSSGGGESAINIQQLPRDAETRACFVAEEGNLWVSEDYQSQESRVLASVSNDSAMLHIYDPGECADMHALVAYKSYPKLIPRDTPIEDISKEYKDLRQEAKKIEFCINYGGTDATMVQNNGLDPAEAKEIYDAYMKGFPGVKKYQDYCRKVVIEKGYILMNPVTRHRAHLEDWDNKWKKIRDFTRQPDYWDSYRRLLDEDPYSKEVYWLRKWRQVKSDFEKASINYRIQNRGAMATKLAGIKVFKWICDNNYQNIIKICIQIHDEYNCECPKDLAEEFALVLQKYMEIGAKPFCPRVPLSSDISRLKDGSIPNYWLH